MVSDERAQQAITFLAETDERAADFKTDVTRKEHGLKKIEAAFIAHQDGAMDYRKSMARISDEYNDMELQYFEALNKSEALSNKRKTESLVFEFWRSLNANRRQG